MTAELSTKLNKQLQDLSKIGNGLKQLAKDQKKNQRLLSRMKYRRKKDDIENIH